MDYIKRTLQFELWPECNNKCDYCYLGESVNHTPDEVKITALEFALETLNKESTFKEYNSIGFIGGEFFQGQLRNPKIKKLFLKVMKKVSDLYDEGKIIQIWIPATLNIGNQKDLYDSLDQFNNLEDTWVITSWDTIGRFKSKKMLDTWDYHMHNLKIKYPKLRFNTTIILTDDCITKYLNNEFSFDKFMKEYNTTLFLKHCGVIGRANPTYLTSYEQIRERKQISNKYISNYYPTRNKFIKFLRKFRIEETQDMWDRLFNIYYRADEVFKSMNDGSVSVFHRRKGEKHESDEAEYMPCGHPLIYSAYIDCDNCILCDKLALSQYE